MRLIYIFVTFNLIAFNTLASNLFAQERIIAMSPSISEILFALDYNSSVVGVSKFASYPKEVKRLPKIGGFFHPNIERILSLRPTLVIAQEHNHQLLKKLNKLGIKTLEVKLNTIKNIKSTIHIINSTLQNHLQEKKLLADIDDAINYAKKTSSKPKVLLMFGAREDLSRGVYVASQDIFYNEILNICHAQNAYTSHLSHEPQLFYEHIVAANPDIIIIFHYPLTDGDVNLKKVKETYSKMPTKAGKKGNIFILSDDYLAIPSHRVAKSITKICDTISEAK